MQRKQINLNSDPKAAVRKLFIKCVGDRDFGTQEVMHHIISLKFHSFSFNVITVSLNGSRQCKIAENGLGLKPTFYDHYADRLQIDKKSTNLLNFISNFELVNKKLKQRKHSVIVGTISQFTSYPNGSNYGQFF